MGGYPDLFNHWFGDEAIMNTVLRTLATVVDRLIWAVGCFAIISYASDHWPLVYRGATVALLLGFGIWYLWMFFIRPFRAGLKGE
jgi:hypothetical protein